MDNKQQKIWQVVSQIPAGKVASYGQVAEQAGIPRGARLVGRVLKTLPEETRLPWHRVVNSQGKLSLPEGEPAFYEQKRRLLLEGIDFDNNRIPRRHFFWD